MKHKPALTALHYRARRFLAWTIVVTTACAMLCLPTRRAVAADHRDGTIFVGNLSHDMDDVYLFLDPNDNSRVILAFDVAGPIIPPENVNGGVFDSSAKFSLQIENTGDAVADVFIDIRFSQPADSASPQTATVAMTGNRGSRTFTAPTTPASMSAIAPAPVVTVDSPTGIMISAGLYDDPFFFDVPAEARYRASLLTGQPDITFFSRARDSFAGYNVLAVVLSIPAARLRGSAGDAIGVSAVTSRRSMTMHLSELDPLNMGPYVGLDRMGVPAINSMFIPYARRDEYNRSSTSDDARGTFAADIRSSLQALGTNAAGIAEVERLARVRGDMLRLNLALNNTGAQGGDNSAAGFPNGRRPADDVMDKLLTLINNQATLGDNVDRNDVGFRSVFPFFAPPHQPVP